MEMTKFTELLKCTETPFYLFDIDQLKKRIFGIQKRLPSNSQLCYAIKANPFLLNAIKDLPLLFEVCSPGELSICKKYNVAPEKIVFSGVCKTLDDIEEAYNYNVKTITLESSLHCKYLKQVATTSKTIHNQEVILRLTSGNQFGMSPDDLKNCINELKKIPSVTIRGIHYFTGTQKKFSKIQEEVTFIQKFCDTLQTETGISFNSIEYGPGLSYNYFSSESEDENFTELENFSELLTQSNYSFVIELGRYIASSCGTYVTTIMDVKANNGNNYCIIDGGINHINYYGQMMGMKLPPVKHIKTSPDGDIQKHTICGSLCTTADVVLREIELNNAQAKDLLVFENIGAYSVTEGIYLFLSHPLPAIYLQENGNVTQVRTQLETYKLNS